MATLLNKPPAVSSMVELVGRMDVAPHDLQIADEFPVAHTMIDNISHTQNNFCIKHNAYESPDAQYPKSCHYESMLNPFDSYERPSEFESNSLLFLPDILSPAHPLDLNAHRVDDLSIQLDEMAIDDSDSSLSASPESIDNQTSATYLENADPLYSVYTNFSLSPPAPSFYNFLEEAGIDIEQYAELLRRYSPDVEWEDIPLSVREYQMQEMSVAQVGDLCHEMESIRISQNSSGSVSPLVVEEFDMTVAVDKSSSLGLFIEAAEELSLMPLRNLICIDSFTGGEGEQSQSALWALT